MLSYLWNFFIIFFPQPHSFGYVAFLMFGVIYMKDMIKKIVKTIPKILFITDAALLALYFLVQIILHICGLQLRGWINSIFLKTVLVIFFAGLLSLFVITKKKQTRIRLLIVLGLILLFRFSLYGMFYYMVYSSIPLNEHIVEIDGYKFIGYEEYLMEDPFIHFYDYKNNYVSGSKKRFTTEWSKTDENGNVIYGDDMRTYEHLEDIYDYREGYWTTDDLD